MKLRAGVLLPVLFFGMVFAFTLASSSASKAAPSSTEHGPYAVPTVAPGEWPMYGHDVMRTNFNPDETTISESNVNQLTQGWHQLIGSNGTPSSSAPSVSGGQVFVGSSAATGPDFYAFDAATGNLSWSVSLSYTSSCFNVGIGSTPAISGTIITVGGGDTAYYGINTANGQIIWRNAMNVGSSGFPWESPLMAYDRTYLGIASRCDNPSVRGEVRAADIYNGSTINSAYFVNSGERGGGIWNSPAMSPDGTKLFVGTGEDYTCSACTYTRSMVSLDPITMQILGYHQEPSPNQDLDYGTTPVVFHDSQGRTLVGANHKNGIFYAYNVDNLNAGAVWSRNLGVTVGTMPAYDPTLGNGGTLFINGGGGSLWAVDPANGSNRWAIGSVVAGAAGNVAIANGLIFSNAGNSGLKIYRESDGVLLRTITPPNNGDNNSGVSVSNGFVYWQAGSYLNAWHIAGTPGPTNTPTNTPSVTSTNTPTHTPTRTFTPSMTPTGPTATRTWTPVPSTGTVTSTPVRTSTPTGTRQATETLTAVASATSTSEVSTTATPVVTYTPVPSATPCTLSFLDVQPSDYFYEAVTYLACHRDISGYSDRTFRPFNNTTRGQLSKIVVLSVGWTIDTHGGPHFSDVPTTNPFYDYIETAYNHGVISGYSDGTFRWGNDVTRAQLSKIIVSAEGWDIDTHGGPHFTDVPTTDPFYGYIETAYNHNIISGYADSTFRPGNNATRGQIVKIVYGAITAP